MTTLAACTIVSKNYLPFVRVLAESFLEHHPQGRLFVLLVDRVDGYFDPGAERFTLVEAEKLGNVPDLPSFLFKYSLLECNTAIKPFFVEHLFERYELDNVVYFDPDILITGGLDELARQVERHNVVLTPHLTDPIDDAAHPGEQTVLQVGAYNLGFIALARGEETARLLAWWKERLYERCLVRLEEGLFVDQKWIDLVPGLFQGVHVLADPGYNAAYWNLHGRRIVLGESGATANGRPLVFFHFSGIDPDDLHHVSKHQDRFVLSDIGGAAGLYRRYSELLLAAGYRDTKPWPYAFGSFDNGVAIPDAARRLYHGLGLRRRRFGDPFATGGGTSFFDWLREPRKRGAGPCLSRLLGHLYERRPDLVRLFPDVDGADFEEFRSWLDTFGRFELGLDEAFLEGALGEGTTASFTLAGVKSTVKTGLKRAYRSELGRKTRRYGKRLLGHERYDGLRRRLRRSSAGPPDGAPARPLGRYRVRIPERLESAGVNVVGYFQAETGMGEAVRALAKALATTGIPVSHHTLGLNVLARQDDPTFEPASSDFRYGVNLFVVNADQLGAVYEHLGGEVFAGRFNVGFWLWELESFPEAWRGAFDLLHEVWTPSTFCADAIAKISPVPVRRVPIPVEIALEGDLGREHFELPAGAFVFLFSFNFLSYFERKNPLALIRAFKRAFPEGDEALLVLKTSQSDFAPAARQAILAEIGGANVRLIDGYLERSEIHHLTALADCAVSLHRSEGFGLTLAEAMVLGTPVVATAYSGNADFFNLNNGYPVRYRLVELEADAGPYPARARWAEPDVEHAAELMRRVFERRGEALRVAARAKSDVERDLGHAAVGRELERRFREILDEVRRHGPRLPL